MSVWKKRGPVLSIRGHLRHAGTGFPVLSMEVEGEVALH